MRVSGSTYLAVSPSVYCVSHALGSYGLEAQKSGQITLAYQDLFDSLHKTRRSVIVVVNPNRKIDQNREWTMSDSEP
jgi:hypothetical protein